MNEYGQRYNQAAGLPIAGGYDAPKMAETARDIGHYGQALQEQEKLLSVMNDEVQMLRQRLEPMLRPSAPTPAESTGGAQAAPSVSQLTGVAQTTNVKLYVLISQIRDLAARFDL